MTTRDVVPPEPKNTEFPEYIPEIVLVPTGAAEELHEPLPLDNDAVQSVVAPVVNVTEPLGVGNPVPIDETFAEYVTELPCVTELGVAPIDVCDGALFTTSEVAPVELPNMVSPEYVPVIVSLPIGAADE